MAEENKNNNNEIGSEKGAPKEQEPAETPNEKSLEDKILYLHAEIENVRKRLQKEKVDLAQKTKEIMLNEFFPIYISLNRALNHYDGSPENAKHVCDGVKMTLKEVDSLFQKHNLQRISGVNCPFDPSQHEALESEEREGLTQKIVLEEYEPGFMVQGHLVRSAKVKVGIPASTKASDVMQESDV